MGADSLVMEKIYNCLFFKDGQSSFELIAVNDLRGPLFLCVGRLEELFANIVPPLGVLVMAHRVR